MICFGHLGTAAGRTRNPEESSAFCPGSGLLLAASGGTARLKLYARSLLELGAALAEIEEGARLEAERPGEQRSRELLNARVVLLHGVVEEPAGRRKLVFDVGQFCL